MACEYVTMTVYEKNTNGFFGVCPEKVGIK